MTRLMVILEATLGGIRRHVVDLLLGLETARYEITFVYSTTRADPTFLTDLAPLAEKGIRLVEIPMQREVRIAADVAALLRLRREMARFRPDIVHAHGAKAGALGRLAAALCRIRRFVYNPHGGVFHKTEGIGGAFYLSVERLLSRFCPTDYIGVSQHSSAEIRRYLKPPPERVHLIYNGIDVEEAQRQLEKAPDIRADLDPRGSGFIVLYPAMFLEAKGHREFIDAVASADPPLSRETVIVLAGDGPLREAAERQIERLGLQRAFRVVGFVTDIYAYYKACDVVILPSRAEAFGYSALEAMAASRPVIATRVGSLPEIVQDGVSGELIEPAGLTRIVEALNRMAAHRENAAALGRQAAEQSRTAFGLSTMVNETDRLYRRLMARS